MSEADRFKNDFSRGSEQAGAIKRKLHSCQVIHQSNAHSSHSHAQKVVACCDEAGIV